MILGRLSLTNFSAFAGTQSIDFEPESKHKPIVLIGGMNGAGKTSLLTAIRLVLFGKRALALEESKMGYHAFIRGLIHGSEQSATIDLSFHTYTLGEKTEYRIIRRWDLKPSGTIHEAFDAWKDGLKNKTLTETWDEWIDALIPASIASLFFFDGEKVAEMATPEGITTLMRVGVMRLLGVDLLERLQNDLQDLIKSKARSIKNTGFGEELSQLDSAIATLAEKQDALKWELADLEDKVLRQTKELAVIDAEFKASGAELYLQRQKIEEGLRLALEEKKKIEHQQVELAAGPLPLMYVRDLLEEVKKQDVKEQRAQKAKAVLNVLMERDEQAIKSIKNAPTAIVNILQTFLEQDRARRLQEAETAEIYLNISEECRSQLSNIDAVLADEQNKATLLSKRKKEAEERIANARHKLSMMPDEKAVTTVIHNRESIRKQLKELHTQKETVINKLEHLAGSMRYKNDEHARLSKRIAEIHVERTEEARTIQYADKARHLLRDYQGLLLRETLDYLQGLIFEGLKSLYRKENFISNIVIDPETFNVQLFNGDLQTFHLSRLSSGERQLLAIGILWGLARASGLPMPIIIDTPLGRLDSEHRENLVKEYFPNASHQVLLLSTDTEINRDKFEDIKEFMSKAFILDHDDKLHKTTVR